MQRMTTWVLTALAMLTGVAHAEPLAVCATTTDLAALVQAVGGDDVSLTTFAKGTEDAHFVEPKPSFLKALSAADLLVLNGLDLEVGWLPKLVLGARNARVRPGGAGRLDASTVIEPLEVRTGRVDRSMGDVHPGGNPHYLLDPVRGLRVAGAIRDALGRLRPERRAAFDERHDRLATRIGEALVGRPLAQKYDAPKLAELFEHGKLQPFLAGRGDGAALAGWLGMLAPHRGAAVVADHALWPYFARRFGLTVVAHLEPKPGYPPTSRHLARVVRMMRERQIGIVLASAYYDPRHAELIERGTGATVLAMANHVRSRPDASDYVSTIDFNVRQLATVLGRAGR